MLVRMEAEGASVMRRSAGGISDARFRCLKATPSGFALSSCNCCKEIAIVSLCELGGSGYVDRYVCRDDGLAQRHGDGAGDGVRGPTAARRRVTPNIGRSDIRSRPGAESRSFGDVASMSKLPSRAVVERTSVHGRKVPQADIPVGPVSAVR